MKYLLRKRTNFLHDYFSIPDGITHEEKQRLNFENYGTNDYTEIDSNEIYSFGCLKSEYDNYKLSDEYNPSNDIVVLLPGEIQI